LKYPWYPCLGNHDVLGWSPREKVASCDPHYGKKLILESLEMDEPYYSFDHRGWHFAVALLTNSTRTEAGRGG